MTVEAGSVEQHLRQESGAESIHPLSGQLELVRWHLPSPSVPFVIANRTDNDRGTRGQSGLLE